LDPCAGYQYGGRSKACAVKENPPLNCWHNVCGAANQRP
jgi:hypothetical protein